MSYYIPNTDEILDAETPYNDEEAAKAFNKYVKTLQQIGYIDNNNASSLLIYVFVMQYYSLYKDTMEDDTKKTIISIINCIKSNSCLFN